VFDLVFVLLAPDATGTQHIVRLTAAVENGVPVLTNASIVGDALTNGSFNGLGVLSDGSRAFVADAKTAQVSSVNLAGAGTAQLTAALPVRDVFPTPAYTDLAGDSHDEGEFLLAVLVDGTMQVLSPTAGGPAPIATGTIEPIRFDSAIQDIAFVPCVGASPCRTPLQVASGDTRNFSLLAFATLASGETVALTPDEASANPPTVTTPNVYRSIDVNGAVPGVSAGPDFTLPEDATNPGVQPSMTLDTGPGVATEGVTLDESYTLTYQGQLPGFVSRGGTFAAAGPATPNTFTLTDTTANFKVQINGNDVVQPHDILQLNSVDPSCKGLDLLPITVTVVEPTKLTVTTPSAFPCTLDASVVYTVTAGSTNSWVLTGLLTGFILRAPGDNLPIAVPGRRFYYPTDVGGGNAFAFTLNAPDGSVQGANFKFTTSSGVSPFIVVTPDAANNAAGSGYATSLAASPTAVYIAATGGNALTVGVLGSLRSTGGITDFR
jgi:hypothetical protein